MSVSPFLLRHFNFHSTLFIWCGWRPKGWRSSLVTGSLNSCDQLGKTGWGKLMCNTLLLCPNGYCQCTIEQGTCCISRCFRHRHSGYAQQVKASCVSVLMCCRYTQEILPCWKQLNLLSNRLPMLQLSQAWSMLGLAARCSEVHIEPELWSSHLTTEPRVFI